MSASDERDIAELRAELDRSSDDGERAGILDALGIQLAYAERHEEALAACTRAVVLRERLAVDDQDIRPRLAASLGNQAIHLTRLGRTSEALRALSRSYDLVQKSGSFGGPVRTRLGVCAHEMSVLLADLHEPELAARFAAVAVVHYFAQAQDDPDTITYALGELGHFADCLDFLDGPRATRPLADRDFLGSLAPGSKQAAELLARRAHQSLTAGNTSEAISDATRVARYCGLFEAEFDIGMMALAAASWMRVATWSMTAGGGAAAAAAARDAAMLFAAIADYDDYAAELAEANCVGGLLSARQDPKKATTLLDAGAVAYADLVRQDRAQFLPALADCLQYGYLLSASRGARSAKAILARLNRLYAEISRDPGSFAPTGATLRERRRFLAEQLSAGSARQAKHVAEIVALLEGLPAAAAPEPTDRRRWCCTGRQLSHLMGDLAAVGIRSSDVYTLGRRLRERNLYPARDFAHRCRPRDPQVFITYTWSENYIDLQEVIRRALDYLGDLVRQVRPHLDAAVIEELVNDKLGVWVDFIFIDQSARDVVSEVREVLPDVIAAADVHFVLSESALLRSWCCYEVALFNQRTPTETSGARTLRSFVGPSRVLDYQGFAATSSTDPEDKRVIEESLRATYPGGLSGVELLLIQASMLSDPFVRRGPAQFGAAEQLVEVAIDKWLAL
jgi:hypothetical protein